MNKANWVTVFLDGTVSMKTISSLIDDSYMATASTQKKEKMYVGSPVSEILYKCKVMETDIPYSYQDDNLTIKALMKIKLLKRYKPEKFTFGMMRVR